MDHSLDGFLIENPFYRLAVQQICLIKFQLLSRDLLNTLQGLLTGIVKIVYDYYLIACIQQLYAGMASDISGAPVTKTAMSFPPYPVFPTQYKRKSFP